MTAALIATRRGAAATAVLAAVVGGLELGYHTSPSPLLTGIAAALATALVLCLGAEHSAVVKWGLLALAIVTLGVLRGGAAVSTSDDLSHHLGRRPITMTGTIRDWRGGSIGRSGTIVDVHRLSDGDGDLLSQGAILVTVRGQVVFEPGDEVEVQASGLVAPSQRPGPRSAAALRRQGIIAIAIAPTLALSTPGGLSVGRALFRLRGWITTTVDSVLGEPAATLMLGIAFGLHRALSSSASAELQDAGLIHVMAVSGLKVVIVAGMVRAFGRVTGWSSRRTAVVAVATVLVFVVVSGASPAAVRSGTMALAGLVLRRDGRRVDPIPVLALVATAMVAFDPAIVEDVGFQLSFLGTVGILMLAEPLARRLPGPRLIIEPLTVTIAAQAITFPITAGAFGVISLVGPLANAVVLPGLPFLIGLGWVGVASAGIDGHWGALPLDLAGWLADALLWIAQLAASVPGAAVHVGSWPMAWTVAAVIPIGIGLVIRRPSRPDRPDSAMPPSLAWTHPSLPVVAGTVGVAAAILLATVAWASPRTATWRVTVLDVGKATSVLVRTPDGGVALIDGGTDPKQLLGALGRVLGPTTSRLDVVVVTGGARDEVGGLEGLIGRYRVGAVVEPGGLSTAAVAIIDRLRVAGSTVMDAGSGGWGWAGANWRMRQYDSPTGAIETSLDAVVPAGQAGSPQVRLLILGDATVSGQEELTAHLDSTMTGVLVTEAGGAVAPALLAVTRPQHIAVPTAPGSASPRTGSGVGTGFDTARTGTDGDLAYRLGGTGLVSDR